jgi:hypothetical protein
MILIDFYHYFGSLIGFGILAGSPVVAAVVTGSAFDSGRGSVRGSGRGSNSLGSSAGMLIMTLTSIIILEAHWLCNLAGSPVVAAVAVAAAVAGGSGPGSGRGSNIGGSDGARARASSPAPSEVKVEVLTKHRYTMMSHPLTLKAALVLKQGLASPLPVNRIISRRIARMLCRSRVESEDACGPLRFQPAEETLSAFDMDSIKTMLPQYITTVASSVTVNTQFSADMYRDLTSAGVVDTQPIDAVWSFDQPPFHEHFDIDDVSCCHQMTTGRTNQYFTDGMIGLIHPTVIGSMYPLCLLECVFGEKKQNNSTSCSFFMIK